MKTIFLGFTNNIDYEIILDNHTLKKMVQDYQISKKDCRKYQNISTIKQLIGYTLYCIENHIGEEKPIDSAALLLRFADLFPYRKTIGGTAARAAIAIAKMGYVKHIYLHCDVFNDVLESLYPYDIKKIVGSYSKKIYPHVIIQYHCEQNDRYSDRIIYTSDPFAGDPQINTEFLDALPIAKCLLVSGFNAIQECDILIRNLKKLQDSLAKWPKKPLIYYESAKFYQQSFRDIVNVYLGKYIDIYSLNQDEFSEIIGTKIDFFDAESVYQSLNHFQKNFLDVPLLLLHTQYYALIFGNAAHNYYSHLCSAVNLACTRALHGDNYGTEQFQKVQKIRRPALDFCRKIQSFGNIACVSSANIQQHKLSTIGLGDAFAGGFLMQLI